MGELQPRASMNREPITVIVPVYRGIDEVRACIESVIRHAGELAFDLLVIDDDSPEEEVRSYLESLAHERDSLPGGGALRTVRNQRNLGFVGTVNVGLADLDGHAVILNADTVVTEGWLDRLHDAATREPDVATVTPLTNFGSICTLPASVIDAFALGGDDPQIDACAAFVDQHGLGRRPEVITGVGFCMFMTRTALDACGTFDRETFGRGYGEEVDFCLRAARVGLRNLVEDRTFVFHHGAVSFGASRQDGLEQGSLLIRSRYPFFRASNRAERRADPLAPSFAALELGLRARDERRPHVLHLLHSDPGALGGTEKHLHTLMAALRPELDFSVLHPVPSGYVLHGYWRGSDGELIEQEFLLPGGARRATRIQDENAAFALRTALDMFDFDAVHIQNLIGHSLSPLAELETFEGQVICSFRDPFLACPNHALLYLGESFCGIPEDLSYCAECLPRTWQADLPYLKSFRRSVAANLDNIDTWVFASQSAADLLLRVYEVPDDRMRVIPHGAIIDLDQRRTELDHELVHREPLRVAFVGLGRAKKGLETVGWLADQLRETSIEIHHFGNLVELTSGQVVLQGPYDNRILPELLDETGIQVVLLPGEVSETFGHVMTEALVAGRPLIVTGYGALGERLRETQAGWTIDPVDRNGLLELVQHLDSCRDELERGTRMAQETKIRTVADTADDYRALYLRSAP
jgi:GT2 family glycosyltransferase/glycosyltransferase involved in cell wall biosynthesis